MDTQNEQIIVVFVASAIFVLLLAILVILFLVIYQKRLVTQQNKMQKLENERQQQMLKATIEGQERERRRLAKDLHDGIGSLLSGLSLNLKHQNSSKNTTEAQREFLTEACEMLDNGIADVRRISHDLMPITLNRLGLAAAIREHIEPYQKNRSLHIELIAPRSELRFSNDLESGLFRVFQELLQNTVKHSQANSVNVLLGFESQNVTLDYTDNGVGFDRSISAGLGLTGIESRIQSLNGTVKIDSAVNQGIQVKIVVPVQHKINN